MPRPPRRREWFKRIARLALHGLVTTLAVAVFLWLAISPGVIGAASVMASAGDLDNLWLVKVVFRPGSILVCSERQRGVKRAWGEEQACGQPDTPGRGDILTAWASATPDAQREWLELEYEHAVEPASIRVYETYNPGAVDRITGFDAQGFERELWRSPQSASVPTQTTAFDAPVSAGVKTRRIRLHIDSPAVPGWNEIDAVGLVDSAGNTQWANAATASSTYASNAGPMGALDPRDLVPSWTGLQHASPAYARGETSIELRCAVGYGWPWPAISGSADVPNRLRGFPVQNLISASSAGGVIVIPFWPIWTGLVADTATFAVIWWLLGLLFLRPIRSIRELLRMRRGACPKCGYDLRFKFAEGCPECGLLRENMERPPPAAS